MAGTRRSTKQGGSGRTGDPAGRPAPLAVRARQGVGGVIAMLTWTSIVEASGCASSHHRVATSHAPPLARVDFVDTSQPLRIVERSPDGTVCVLWAGLRAVLSRDAVTLAEESFRDPVVGAVHAEHGWVFAARDGAVAQSDTFAGPLHVLAPLDLPDTLAGGAIATAVDLDGRVLLSDGLGPFVSTPTQPPSAVVRAIFESDRHGAAVLASGELYDTPDGGRSWRYAGASIPVAALRVDEFGLYVQLPGQALPRALQSDGTLAAPGPRVAAGLISTTPSETELSALRERVRAALRQRNPAFALSASITRVPDGRLLIADGRDVVEVTPTGERRRRATPVTLSTLVRERHGVDLTGFDVYSTDLSVGVSLLMTMGDSPPLLRVGRLGQAPHDVVLSRPLSDVVAVDASHAWGWAADDEGPRAIAVSVDLATGSVDELSTSPLNGPCRAGVCEFVADGTLFVAAGRTLVRVGPQDRAQTALPEGASRVAFADARRGMAYGEHNDVVWITRDSGRSWSAVDLGGPATDWTLVGRDAICHTLGCFVAGIAIEGYDVARLRSRIVANARRGGQPEAPWAPSWLDRMPDLRCQEAGALTLPPWTRAGDTLDVVTAPTGEVRIVQRPATLPDSRMELAGCAESVEWRGIDAGGPFYAASPWHTTRAQCRDVRFMGWLFNVSFVRTLSRERATVVSYSSGPLAWEYSVLRVASTTELATERGTLADQGMAFAWFTPHGGVFRGDRVAPYVTAYGRSGRAMSRLLPDGDVNLSHAEYGSTLGAVYWVARAPELARFVPADESLPGEPVVIPSSERVPLCARPTTPGALRIAVQGPPRSDADARGQESTRVIYTVELDDDRACIRAAQGIYDLASLAWPATGGGLVGVTYRPSGAVQIRCELTDRP